MSQSHAPHKIGHDDSHGSFHGYMIGTVLSLMLTLASFGVVMGHVVPPDAGLMLIVVLCVAQLVVQLVYFLHIGASRSQRANTGIFLCTAFLIIVIVGLSLWVMHNANVNMMPTHVTIERAMAHD
ncbi:cytochrome o ubiquinol oxidase subunit IV [Paraburkholderia denitrificans]|uniref:Cytochrome bo(3) ubiquinol oxidase subunit 4 n=1 Tax=Paraburkholderia denitrificans TaxID=694025 RepID=A0ABW0JHL9_9BURK